MDAGFCLEMSKIRKEGQNINYSRKECYRPERSDGVCEGQKKRNVGAVLDDSNMEIDADDDVMD